MQDGEHGGHGPGILRTEGLPRHGMHMLCDITHEWDGSRRQMRGGTAFVGLAEYGVMHLENASWSNE